LCAIIDVFFCSNGFLKGRNNGETISQFEEITRAEGPKRPNKNGLSRRPSGGKQPGQCRTKEDYKLYPLLF
jgi:hypothetical protein